MQEDKFLAYFHNCPIVYVSGRTFPVTVHSLEHIRVLLAKGGKAYNTNRVSNTAHSKRTNKTVEVFLDRFDPLLVADLIAYIIRTHDTAATTAITSIADKGQAILVFLSGIQAIQSTYKAIQAKTEIFRKPIQVHKLHSSIPPEQQRRVFRATKVGEWKIVLATNIG